VEAVHAHGKPIILHSCGNLAEVMEDIIACGWDARHSFEDQIEPVWEAKARWGKRIALLGGFDMDKLARMTAAEVRAHTRFLIEKCAPGGGWALGTGNSVANYIPVDNFLTMLEEGHRCGRY
jgi:uroporphyrinogen decarboxylase